MSEKLLYTAEEAAERLTLSRAQIFRLIATGELKSVKIGKARRISERALEEFVQLAEEATAG